MSSRHSYPHVFNPFVIRGVLFKNRLEQAPPGCFFAADDSGFVTDDFVSYFRQYARGGVAVCTVGNCTIDIAESCDEPRQLQMQDPACVQPLKYFSEMCESYGAHGSLGTAPLQAISAMPSGPPSKQPETSENFVKNN